MNAPFVAHNPSNAADPFNYIRPTNQVVLLLSRDHSFPPFPLELAGSVSTFPLLGMQIATNACAVTDR